MKKNLVKNFYKKIIYNLKNSKNLFYKNNETKFKYQYIHQKIKIVTTKLKNIKKNAFYFCLTKVLGTIFL